MQNKSFLRTSTSVFIFFLKNFVFQKKKPSFVRTTHSNDLLYEKNNYPFPSFLLCYCGFFAGKHLFFPDICGRQ